MTGTQQVDGVPGAPPLKLRARDAEDLRALATCLQDALVPLTDVAYLKAEKRFVMVANRFMWERDAREAPLPESAAASAEAGADARFEEAEAGPLYYRVNCAVTFDRVRNVRFRGLDPREKDQILSLLTLEVESGAAEPGAVQLVFAGGGTIRLEMRGVRCHLEDGGEPWPTHWRPSHAEAEAKPNSDSESV